MKLRQCRLRSREHPEEETVAWIDERGAIEGYYVELLLGKGVSEWWIVKTVYDGAVEQSDLEAQKTLNRNSLPSLKEKR